MRIVVNGDEREIPDGTTVRELLAALQVKTRGFAVERNREIVPSAQHVECILFDGDRLEIVTLVGGG
jgi:sulfur carrier protein